MNKFKEIFESLNEAKQPEMSHTSTNKDGDSIAFEVTDKIDITLNGRQYVPAKEMTVKGTFKPFSTKVSVSFEEWLAEFSKLTSRGTEIELSDGGKLLANGGKYAEFRYFHRKPVGFIESKFEDVKTILKVVNKAVKYAMKNSGQSLAGPAGTEFVITKLDGKKYSAGGNKSSDLKRISTEVLGRELARMFNNYTPFVTSDKTSLGKGASVFMTADDKVLKQIDNKEISTTICHEQGCSLGEIQLKITLKKK